MSAGLKGRGVISKITWAILKDSGWYDLAQDFSEPLIWGKGAGCAFARKFCYEQLSPSGYRYVFTVQVLVNYLAKVKDRLFNKFI